MRNMIQGKKFTSRVYNISNEIGKTKKRRVNNGIIKSKLLNIKQLIFNEVSTNIREYIIVSIFFLIGVIVGVVVINNSDLETQTNIQGYINTFINSLKNEEYKINIEELLKSSIINNVKLAIIIWFVGSTVVGMPLLYGIIVFRGYCLGYTIAAIIATLGNGKGVTFVLSSLLLQNLLIIPTLFALSISGRKLYKAIIQDKRKENIKVEICKHSIFSFEMLVILIIAAVIETYCSGNLIMITSKYM